MVEGKNIALEAMRGVAAFVVLFVHSVVGFFPNAHPALQSGPWNFFFNGDAAVIFFFVLSGYVLTVRYFRTGDAGILIRGSLKRWPRLAGLTLPIVLASCALLYFGFYFDREVAAFTGSKWMMETAPSADPTAPDFWRAFLQGAFRTFIWGDNSYNTALWTMRHEFFGSFGAFALAFVMHRFGWPRLAFVLTLIVAVIFTRYFACFVVGVAIAWVFAQKQYRLPIAAAVALLVIAAVLFSLTNLGFFTLRRAVHIDTYVHTFAATLALIAVLSCAPLAERFSGPFAAWLGRISFPLYIVHLPVLFSAGCFAYLKLSPWSAVPITIAISVTIATAVSFWDAWWTKLLSRDAERAWPRSKQPSLA